MANGIHAGPQPSRRRMPFVTLLTLMILALYWGVAGRWLVLACYGAFDELTQLLVNRNADVMDWLADIAGSALGLGIVNLFVWLFRRPSPPSEGVLALKPVD
jgi:VanZ family protein